MGAANGETISVEVLEEAIENSYLSVGRHGTFFPPDAYGGTTADNSGTPLTLWLEGRDDPLISDIDAKGLIRARFGWRSFYETEGLSAGDRVVIERLGEREYRVFPATASRSEGSPPDREWSQHSLARESVLAAMAEFDREGRDASLRRHGFRRALDYVVVHDGKEYDSKALYGISYGIQHPDEEPIRTRGLQGGRFVIDRLKELGFEVRSLKQAAGVEPRENARAWIIRAGQSGENEDVARSEGVALIGWSELGELAPETTRAELKEAIRTTYGEERERSLDAQVSSIYRFIHEVENGDVVVLPLQSERYHVAIGIVTGPYVYRADGPFAGRDAHYQRPVEWLARAVPYDRFDQDLREAFGVPGTLSEMHRADVVSRLLEATRAPALHLVVKWSERHGANTVDEHRAIAEEVGRVWWGLIGSAERPKLASKWLDAIQEQLAAGQPTYVFISGPTSWRTRLSAISASREDVEAELIPSYYPGELEHGLWVELSDFEPIEREWLTGNLELVSAPGKPLSEGALSNQPNLLIVQFGGGGGQVRKVWWVCQGQTYRTARDLGLMWAPKTARDGGGRPYWRALQQSSPGDLVLHYADNNVRAVSTISAAAVDAPRPEGLSGDWVDGDGWLVGTDYRELDEPIALTAIPEDWRIAERGPFTRNGTVQQGYFFPLSDRFVNSLASRFPQLGLGTPATSGRSTATAYVEPSFPEIEAQIASIGLRISERSLRRYHVSLKTRGFVILAGISGGGKTWLAEAYGDAVGAERLVVPVAPNWTTNEDLLGYLNPIDGGYRHTEFSRFLQRAAAEFSDANASKRAARPFHVILDEMNLARVEYYFAKFLSAMEARAREGTAPIQLSDELEVPLTPNLKFVGTLNVDETTFGFADKVYDRAQLLELEVPREALASAMAGQPYREAVLEAWDAVQEFAPFAFRVLGEIKSYVEESSPLGVPWEQALDEQLLQKVLPKLRGTDPRIRDALEKFVQLAETEFPLSHAKASGMLADFDAHGFASYF